MLPRAYVDRTVLKAKVYDRFQFERIGFFSVDPDSSEAKVGAAFVRRFISQSARLDEARSEQTCQAIRYNTAGCRSELVLYCSCSERYRCRQRLHASMDRCHLHLLHGHNAHTLHTYSSAKALLDI